MKHCDDDGMDCDQVLQDVWLFLDNEMDPGARAAVAQHLDDCSPCLAEAGLEEKLKKLIHRTCGGDRAPEQLRAKVFTAIQSVQVTTASADGRTHITRTTAVAQVRLDPGDDPSGNPRR